MVDECVGKPIVIALGQKLALAYRQTPYAYSFVFESLTDIYRQGTRDPVWIPELRSKRVILITSDRGKGGRDEKLPFLCYKNGVTHVVLSNKLHHGKSVEKADAIESVFMELLKLASAPRGSGYWLIREHGECRLAPRDYRTKSARKKKKAK